MGGVGDFRQALETVGQGSGLQIDVALGAGELIKPVQVLAWHYSDPDESQIVITDLDDDEREVMVGDVRGLWKDGRLIWPSRSPGTAWTVSGRWSPLVPGPTLTAEDAADIQRRADDYLRRRDRLQE